MQVKTAKAAILAESRKPLIVDEITLPDALGVGQVLVKVLYTTICGAQINEIAAAKGPDKFLPHLLGHEASAEVSRDRPRRHQRQAGRHRGAALAAEPRHPVPAAGLSLARQKLNAGWVTTFNEYAVISENRMTAIPADFDLKIAPLLGCAVTTAAGVISNDAKREDRRIGRRVRRRRRRPQRRAVRPARRRQSDRRRRPRSTASWTWPSERGATHTINPSKVEDVGAAHPQDRRRQGARQGDRDDRRQSR